MASDADAYERGVKISQTSLTPNFREGVQANPWFQLGYQMGLKHGASAAGMMSRAKSEFPAVAARLQASRPGTPARFAVEDRFYFGKGRKERFAEPREIEAKIRAWIDSRGLPIGSQETNALSYVAAQHMIRGGASIEQAVKSAARRHAQIGLASAGLRTWLEENA